MFKKNLVWINMKHSPTQFPVTIRSWRRDKKSTFGSCLWGTTFLDFGKKCHKYLLLNRAHAYQQSENLLLMSLYARPDTRRTLGFDPSGGRRSTISSGKACVPASAVTMRANTCHWGLGRFWEGNKLTCLAEILARVTINTCEVCLQKSLKFRGAFQIAVQNSS